MRAQHMAAALVHRGPDDSGAFHGERVELVMRRLAVIDVIGGHQPFRSATGVVLIANGEIYNFVELRADLEARNHRFRTRSDCETILHLYEEYGLDFVHHLRGMFALALWDERERRLVLARDRMGEKPLYLARDGDAWLFASELRALLAAQRISSELDNESIDLYFHYGYVPEPRTPLLGVRKLPPAHLWVLEGDDREPREICYWRMRDAAPLRAAPEAAIAEVLDEVGRIVVRADVPIGVALSGGLDSSAIAALAVRHAGEAVAAIGVGYEGRPACDERTAAAELARHLGLPFHGVEITTDEVVRGFPDLVRERDDPIADPAGPGYRAVMRAAHERGIRVMLLGQGGDELFWGYPWVRAAARRAAAGGLPCAGLRYALAEPARPGLRGRAAALRDAARQARRAARVPPGRPALFELEDGFEAARRRTPGLYTAALREALIGFDPGGAVHAASPAADPAVRLTELICAVYLTENGIAQVDRLGMASSVEVRLPFLDHRLVETVIGLRRASPDHEASPKSRLIGALVRLLPDFVLRRPKRGFEPPFAAWNRGVFAHHGQSLVDGALVSRGILRAEAAHHAARAGLRQPRDWLFHKLLVLELWCRQLP